MYLYKTLFFLILYLHFRRSFIFIGLFLIATGNGNIRGCITSLGAQQFKVPEQNEQLSSYFTHYYVLYTWGVLLSKMIPPSVRAETHCFGKDDCYLAVFGVLAASFFFCWSKYFCSISDNFYFFLFRLPVKT